MRQKMHIFRDANMRLRRGIRDNKPECHCASNQGRKHCPCPQACQMPEPSNDLLPRSMRYIVAVLAVIACTAVIAAHVVHATEDSWTGSDKGLHVMVGAMVGSPVTLATKDPHWGFAAGAAAGLAKEIADSRSNGRSASAKDFTATALGAAVGAYGSDRLFIGPNRIVYQIKW